VRNIRSKRSLPASIGCGQCQVIIGLVCWGWTINTRLPPHLSSLSHSSRVAAVDNRWIA